MKRWILEAILRVLYKNDAARLINGEIKFDLPSPEIFQRALLYREFVELIKRVNFLLDKLYVTIEGDRACLTKFKKASLFWRVIKNRILLCVMIRFELKKY